MLYVYVTLPFICVQDKTPQWPRNVQKACLSFSEEEKEINFDIKSWQTEICIVYQLGGV